MTPTYLARLVINGFDHALAPNAVIRASPSIDSIGGLGEIDAVAGMGVNDKQSVLGVEARRTVVGHAPLVGRKQASVGCRFFGRIRNRTAVRIHSERPVQGSEGSG